MPALKLAQLREELLSLYAPPLRAKATRSKVRQVLDELAQLSRVTTTRDLSPATIARWLASPPRPRRPETWRSLLRTLRAICRYAVFRGYARTDPFEWRPPSAWLPDSAEETAPFDRHRSALEIRRVLDQADAEAASGSWPTLRLRALVYLYAFTGCRRNEALGLMVADFDLPRRVLTIRTNPRRPLKTKQSGQPLALAAPLAVICAAWLPITGSVWAFPGIDRRGPWIGGGPGNRAADQLRELGRRAGVPGLSPGSFRHTFGTLAETWGLGELELQRWLRHTNPRTQRAYRKADLDNLTTTALKIAYPGLSDAS